MELSEKLLDALAKGCPQAVADALSHLGISVEYSEPMPHHHPFVLRRASDGKKLGVLYVLRGRTS